MWNDDDNCLFNYADSESCIINAKLQRWFLGKMMMIVSSYVYFRQYEKCEIDLIQFYKWREQYIGDPDEATIDHLSFVTDLRNF